MPEPGAQTDGGPPAGGARRPGARERVEATVRGRVQGVGFRRYVQRWARELALDGWVRNEPDGTVRLVAEGAPGALDRLVRLLWGGPPGASVDGVEAGRTDGQGEPSGFRVAR